MSDTPETDELVFRETPGGKGHGIESWKYAFRNVVASHRKLELKFAEFKGTKVIERVMTTSNAFRKCCQDCGTVWTGIDTPNVCPTCNKEFVDWHGLYLSMDNLCQQQQRRANAAEARLQTVRQETIEECVQCVEVLANLYNSECGRSAVSHIRALGRKT